MWESFLHTNIHNYILLLENRHLNFEIISYGKCTIKKFYITIMQYMCKVCKNNSHFLLNTSCPLKHQQTKMTYNTMQGAKFCITITSHLLPDPVLQNTESESRCIPIWVHFFRIGFQEIRTWTELGAFSRVHNGTDVKQKAATRMHFALPGLYSSGNFDSRKIKAVLKTLREHAGILL